MNKGLSVVVSLIIVALVGFAIAFACSSKVRDWTYGIVNKDSEINIDSEKIYTNADLENAFNDGYSQGNEEKTEYENMISNLNELLDTCNAQKLEAQQAKAAAELQLAQKTEQTEALTSEKEVLLQNIQTLNNTILQLTAIIETLEIQISTGNFNTNIIRFYINGALSDVKFIESGEMITLPQYENSEDVRFSGWSIDGTTPVEASDYEITGHTNFFATLKTKHVIDCNIVISLDPVSDFNNGVVTLETIMRYDVKLPLDDLINLEVFQTDTVLLVDFNMRMTYGIDSTGKATSLSSAPVNSFYDNEFRFGDLIEKELNVFNTLKIPLLLSIFFNDGEYFLAVNNGFTFTNYRIYYLSTFTIKQIVQWY